MEPAQGPEHSHEALQDEWLGVRCQLGEPDAFDLLIERWHTPLWKYARRASGSDEAAADIVQDTWLRVFRGIARLRDATRLRAWLFGIARRVVMDRLRDRYAEPDMAAIDLAEIPESHDTQDLADEIELMQRGLGRLPAIERDVLELFYLQELSLAEIADILGVPLGTVKSRLFRARHLLREQLRNEGART